MLPVFKSHYSIGKSILTLSDPNKDPEGGSDSIFKLCMDAGLDRVILVDDAPTGFLEARKRSFDLNINLIFGVRLKLSSFNEPQEDDKSIHKVIVFAKNDDGCNLLNKIYSSFFCDHDGVGNYSILKKFWSEDNLLLAVPFYDSFLYYNSFYFANCVPDLSFCNPVFLIEDNNLPTDLILSKSVNDYCKDNSFKTELAKSIYYNRRSDIEAFQTYKCICNRSFGRKQSLSNPGFDGLGSREFCFESWEENK
jgi:DNA polymerase III alpha subunit